MGWTLPFSPLRADPPGNEDRARKWLVALRHAMDEEQARPVTPAHQRYPVPDAAPVWAVKDTSARAYKEARLRMRTAFLDSVLRHTPRVFEQEAWVVEFPLSGEVVSLQYFLLYRSDRKVLVNKYYWGWSDKCWHVGNTATGRPQTVQELQSSSWCDGHGANSGEMAVVRFQNHGTTVSAHYYPPGSYCGKLDLFYSM
jgi:hypothetical protein